MKKKSREKIINVTMFILDILARFGGATSKAFLDQKSFYTNTDHDFSREQIRNRIRALINSGQIEAIEESGRKSIRLTRKGKIKWLEKVAENETDKKWRIISFDIPDRMKNLRIQLTRNLRRVGYKPVQKSLWASPFVKSDAVDLIIEELNLAEFVAYFVIEKTDIEKHLQELFDEPD